MFIIFDIIVDLIINAYVALGYGTPQRKINIRIDKLSKYNPEIKDLYDKNKRIFEENPELSNLILNANIRSREEKQELSRKIQLFFKTKHV